MSAPESEVIVPQPEQQQQQQAPPETSSNENNTTTTTSAEASSPVKKEEEKPVEQQKQEEPVASAPAETKTTTSAPVEKQEENSPQPKREEPAKTSTDAAAVAGSNKTNTNTTTTEPKKAPSKSKSQGKTNNNNANSAPRETSEDNNNDQQQQQQSTPRRESSALAEVQLTERLGKLSASARVLEGEKILRERMRMKYGKGSANFRSHTERTSLANGPRKSETATSQALKVRELDEERRQAAARKFNLDERTLASKEQAWTFADPCAIGNNKVAAPKWKRPSGAKDEIQAGRRIPVKYNAPGPGAYYDPLGWLGGLK